MVISFFRFEWFLIWVIYLVFLVGVKLGDEYFLPDIFYRERYIEVRKQQCVCGYFES